MSLNEFSLIESYFKSKTITREEVALGIGDDAAVIDVPTSEQLVVTTDCLVEGVHFPQNVPADKLANRALAVNLSDLAAMGATPKWMTLALTLPEATETWLTEFSAGLFNLAQRFQVQLVGGDITQGPLTITLQVMGTVPQGKALTRGGAQVGDLIYVTGRLGEAVLPQLLPGEVETALQSAIDLALYFPEPRVATGQALQTLATAAIDISDGLAADLHHLCKASGVGADLMQSQIPIAKVLQATCDPENALNLALTNGDDYELCFTVPASKQASLTTLTKTWSHPCICIGKITDTKKINLINEKQNVNPLPPKGYQHFK